MRNKLFAVLAGLLLGGIAVAYGQSISVPTQTYLNTSDLIQVVPQGIPSAGNHYATPSLITNTVGYQISVPLTAFSLTFVNGQTYWYIQPAGTLATGTFTFEPNPGDGAKECVRSTQTQTAVTMTANTGQTVGGTAVTAMTANTTYCWLYQASSATWYPI